MGNVSWIWFIGALAVGAGCSSPTSEDDQEDPAGEVVLRTTSVTIQPGEERYLCWTLQMPDDAPFALSRVDFELPDDIHHYQLQTQAQAPAEQPFDCALGEGGGPEGGGPEDDDDDGPPGMGPPGGFPTLLALGGPGTSPTMQFPAEAAAILQPGALVVLQLHLLNATGDPRTIAPAAVTLIASDLAADPSPIGVLLVNDGTIELPPGSQDVEAGFDCVLPAALENVFSVWPHMHLLGKHIEVGIGDRNLVQTAWSFENQRLYDLAESAAAGDAVTVRCRYDNPTGEQVRFGMSTTDEMCSAFIYYYPAVPGLGLCENE